MNDNYYVSQDEKNMAVICHVLGIFTGILGPLIIWLVKKDESPFVKDNARHALNFQLSVLIYGFVSFLLVFIVIGILGLIALSVVNLIFCILAAVDASNGKLYKYPLAINFIK